MKKIKVSATLVYGVTLLALFFLAAAVAEKQPETGVIKEGVYRDSRFGFSVKLPQDWREAKLRKEPTAERLVMTQRKPRVPIRLQDNADQAAKPTAMFFADTCNMTPEIFYEFLQRDTVRSELKDRILTKSVFLEQGSSNHIEILDQTHVTVAGKSALKIRGRLEYAATVQKNPMDTPTMIRDFRAGFIYIIPFDGWLMYIEEVAESQFLPSLTPDFDMIVKSLTVDSTVAK